MNKLGISVAVFGSVVAAVVACGSQDRTSGFDTSYDSGAGSEGGPSQNDDSGPIAVFGEGGAPPDASPPSVTRDPVDCTEAQTTKSYVGCDYWPTVTANNVWSIFDYAVVVSNVGTSPATVTVTGGALTAQQQVTVAPGALQTIYLPWVPELKGPDFDNCTSAQPMTGSVVKTGGAYHLVSSTPVIVYQFNALEYKGAGGPAPITDGGAEGGADGGAKDWSSCPGNTTCSENGETFTAGCFSFSNDASLLLPSTAMTVNYRVIGHTGWSEGNGLPPPFNDPTDILGAYITVTATQDATDVTATLSANAKVLAGGGITAQTGGTLKFTLAHAGDVAEIVLDKGDKYDLSGSLVQATKPIQVISGVPCINVPEGTPACDHIEESVIPAETLGKHYIVTMPDQPLGGIGKGVVRFYGNQNTTTLTYNPPTPPKGCPSTLNAGQVVECSLLGADFEVTGDKEFATSIFTPGASAYASGTGNDPPGDPDQSIFPSVEQFRTKYLFLAPTDYDTSYVDIVGTSDAAPILDTKAVTAAFTQIGAGPYGVWRVTLDHGPNGDGAHALSTTTAVGIQVMGYGGNTSYQYPGGLNLNLISAPPPPPGVN